MMWARCWLFILLPCLLLIINMNSFIQSEEQKSAEVHLQPPHLSDKVHSNRPPIRTSLNRTRSRTKHRKFHRKNLLDPCNGTYLKTNGTTCGLKEIMIGRCYEYEYVKRGFSLSNQSDVKNCTKLYQTFEDAVRYKSFCRMNMSTYADYFEMALSGVHVINRAMFWSGTYAVAHAYSANGLNYITLEDTLAAAMVNGLMWCGKENDTAGYDFVSCPNTCKDNKWADVAFWGLASKTFAELAAGEVYVILNGSQTTGRTAFRNNSYFSEFELPNFRHNGTYSVTKVNILLLHSPDQPGEMWRKSLLILEDFVRRNGFDYTCVDDPDELILIMCGNQWNTRECQVARRVLREAWNAKLYGISHGKRNSFSLMIFLCIFLCKIIL